MLKEITNNSNFLNTLFTEKDFDFLSTYDLEIKKLEEILEIQKSKREEIIKFINKLDSVPETDKNVGYKDLLQKAEEVFEIINSNIQNVHSIEKDLYDLDTDIVNLIVEIENNKNDEIYYKSNVETIKNKINEYSANFSKINNMLKENDKNVDILITNIAKTAELLNIKAEFNNIQTNAVMYKNEINKNQAFDDLVESNNVLLISEKEKKVFLPYTKEEIEAYYNKYSKEYKSYQDVIKQDFIFPLEYYTRHTKLARFRETYSLIRDREAKSIFEALKKAIELCLKYDLNPAIISACKNEEQLDFYIECLDNKKLEEFDCFEIRYEMNPL